MRKLLAFALAGLLCVTGLAGCTAKDDADLNVAVIETAYGSKIWQDIVSAFEEMYDVKVNLTIDKNLEDVISPQMKSGTYPDVVHLATGRPAALTETMIKDDALRDLTAVMDMTVPGEDVKVKDKILPGFLDNTLTNPYSDGKTYLAPMFYGPCGLFYNAGLFEEKGWTVPTTWDEMWELGEKAKAEGIALFTYPTTGYFDAMFYGLMYSVGGEDFFKKATTYSEGVWDTEEANTIFTTMEKLATYTDKTTVANANNDNYMKNQQLVVENKALFMPNGSWVIGEMAEVPKADGFEWGFAGLPAFEEGGDIYSYTFFEQVWSPKESKNQELADKFIAFLYSDKAADIFLTSGAKEEEPKGSAIQPIQGISDKLSEDDLLLYGIYDEGRAKAATGAFATTDAVEGVSMADSLFGTFNSIVSGDKTVADWKDAVTKANDALRAALK